MNTERNYVEAKTKKANYLLRQAQLYDKKGGLAELRSKAQAHESM